MVHSWFEGAMGPQRAGTLMEMLPPVGWGDVATKQDLAHLREHMDMRFEHVEETMATKLEVSEMFRTQLWAMITTNIGLAAVILSAVKLF